MQALPTPLESHVGGHAHYPEDEDHSATNCPHNILRHAHKGEAVGLHTFGQVHCSVISMCLASEEAA